MRLILFAIGLIFGAAGGFLAAGGLPPSHDHAGHGDAAHDHSAMTQWGDALPVPTVTLALAPDTMSGVNLQITTTGYTMTPEIVGQADQPGGGHAHVYLNGTKLGRVYSDWVHIADAATGDVIRVTLNGNSHSGWMGPNGPLAAEITVP